MPPTAARTSAKLLITEWFSWDSQTAYLLTDRQRLVPIPAGWPAWVTNLGTSLQFLFLGLCSAAIVTALTILLCQQLSEAWRHIVGP